MKHKSTRNESPDTQPAIDYLTNSLNDGRPWEKALIEAMAFWTLSEELYNGKHHRYLIDGEAFDWHLLAGRLLDEVGNYIPENEKRSFLDSSTIPDSITEDEFKVMLGPEKYSAHLNYWYGVVVEQALIMCYQDDEFKKLHSQGLSGPFDVEDLVFNRIYGMNRTDLRDKFYEDKGEEQSDYNKSKEFTYWLFKYRLINGEAEKVASDTKRAILYLQLYQPKAFANQN